MLSNNTDYINNLLNQLAYVDVKQNWEPGDNLCTVIESTDPELAGQLREAGLGDYVIKDYQNDNSTNGFAATAFENPDTGEAGMSFRGTENLNDFGSDIGGVITGDEEAINSQIDMLDNGSTAITGDSAQAREAVEFFERNRSHTGQNYLYGHSKGGELASQVYAQYHMLINEVHVINPQPINPQSLTEEQRAAFNNGKFDAIVVDGDLVWKLGDAPYSVRIVENNGSQDGFFGPHALQSATYDSEGNAVIEDDPFKDYFWQEVAGGVANFVISGLQGLYNFVSNIFSKGPVYLTRDFSEASKQKMLGLVAQVENEKWCDFTDWVGDRWYDFEDLIGTLDVRYYINNVNSYHKKVIDKNNTTAQKINEIFTAVRNVDASYSQIFSNIHASLQQLLTYIGQLAEVVTPGHGRFNGEYMASVLKGTLDNLSLTNVQRIKDTLVQVIGGEEVFDEDLILEYLKKNPAEMTDDEMAAVVDTIARLKDTVAFYESAASVGDDELGADFWNRASWASETTKYDGFSAVSAHYNQLYVSILDGMLEQGEDSNTFAAALLKFSNGEAALTIAGLDCSETVGKLFGSSSAAAYAAKWKSEHSEQYFLKLAAEESTKFGAKNGIDGFKEWAEDKLKKNDNLVEEKDTAYFDSDGNRINSKDAPTFYDKEFTIGEVKEAVSVSASIYDASFNVGENGKIDVTVGEAEADASVSAGFYVIGADGEKKFSPGVNAEVGASVTAFEAGWEQQWLGDENLGLNTDVGVTAGKAEAKAEVGAQIFGDDGKLDVQLGASASAEAIAGEAEASVGVNVLGGEVGVTGGVNFGIGAHADVGYRDGVFKCDIGASLGVGVSLDVEVDIGGMVDGVCDAAEAVGDWAADTWDDAQYAWNDFWSW